MVKLLRMVFESPGVVWGPAWMKPVKQDPRTHSLAAQNYTYTEDITKFAWVEFVLESGEDFTNHFCASNIAALGNQRDFTYFALCRGVQIMGATLTVERNAELEQRLG